MTHPHHLKQKLVTNIEKFSYGIFIDIFDVWDTLLAGPLSFICALVSTVSLFLGCLTTLLSEILVEWPTRAILDYGLE